MHFLYYNLIAISILGYGFFFNKSLNLNSRNIGIIGLAGIFFLILLSYISSFFVAHGYIFNSIILSIGIFFLLYFFNKNQINKKDLITFFLVFLFLFIFIMNGKNHDDFPYYHFPYTFLLTQDSHPFGLGQINNGFRNPSSLFFLNSLFYLPKIDIYLLHVGSVYFLGFANLFFLKNIFDQKKYKNIKFYNLLNLFFLVFINIFFYRLAEYGTDRLGSILIIMCFMVLFLLINNDLVNIKSERKELVGFLFIIGSMAISMKPFYLIYFSLIFFLIYYKNLNETLLDFLRSKLSILIFLFVGFIFFINFVNSGCLLFPAKFTCFEQAQWSVSKKEVEDVRIWYELWAKGGATPNFTVENREIYIINFNWLPNWIDVYFFNKISDYFIGIIITIIILYLFFKTEKKINIYQRNSFILILFLFFYLVEWFLFHPSLRYGGYHIFILLAFIPLSIHLERYKLKWADFKKRSIILIFITLIVFLGRNINRLDKEYNVYNYNIFENMNYKFIGGDKDFYFRYENLLDDKNLNHNYLNFLGKKILIITN